METRWCDGKYLVACHTVHVIIRLGSVPSSANFSCYFQTQGVWRNFRYTNATSCLKKTSL